LHCAATRRRDTSGPHRPSPRWAAPCIPSARHRSSRPGTRTPVGASGCTTTRPTPPAATCTHNCSPRRGWSPSSSSAWPWANPSAPPFPSPPPPPPRPVSHDCASCRDLCATLTARRSGLQRPRATHRRVVRGSPGVGSERGDRVRPGGRHHVLAPEGWGSRT
jgi:hypothetical protein